MKRVLTPLLLLLAHATHRELIRQVQYLRVENQILRSKLPVRVTLTAQERCRLVKFGRAVGLALKGLISVVSYRTFTRWISGRKKGRRQVAGRPRKPIDLRRLVLRLARETGWGYIRIVGELRKLGVRAVCVSTVRNILREEGLDPGPARSQTRWDQFIAAHATTLFACDLIHQKVWTTKGCVGHFLVFFIHLDSRLVWASRATAHPTGAWVAQ